MIARILDTFVYHGLRLCSSSACVGVLSFPGLLPAVRPQWGRARVARHTKRYDTMGQYRLRKKGS